MKLTAITIQKYRNFVEPQRIVIEDDVTSLVGKNESGKTTILKALHRLNPANGTDLKFDLTTEYPRWRLAPDRRQNPNLEKLRPIHAEYSLDQRDVSALSTILGCPIPPSARVHSTRSYSNARTTWIRSGLASVIDAALTYAGVDEADAADLKSAKDLGKSVQAAKDRAKVLRGQGQAARAKALTAFATAAGDQAFMIDGWLSVDQQTAVVALTPRYFYFSNYSVLPGETDLTELSKRLGRDQELTDQDRTVVALLAHAGETPDDFLDANYDSRKAELQAASVDLSRRAFEYWKQNEDLDVVFDTDNVVARHDPQGNEIAHRILKIELRDGRHGNVETNFATRSTGFQWFFSFFAAFAEYQDTDESVVVLLDEPGTSLHGEAQKDFLRFIFEELGARKQTIYTTHSQHMVDPAKYEKIRAVHDRATRNNPDLGVVVTLADFSTDRDTILPLEAALGYTVSQHLFLGSGQHLAVEGSSDFVYLQRMSEHLLSLGRTALDQRLSIIPVGGADNMPVFVALLGRRLRVSALIDGAATSSKADRVRRAAEHNGVDPASVVAVGEIDKSIAANGDIEDLFDVSDYLKLYNWAFGKTLKLADLPPTTEPILKRIEALEGKFDHAIVAHTFTDRREAFLSGVKATTLGHFEELFARLNAVQD